MKRLMISMAYISTKLIKIGASKLKLQIALIVNQCLIHGIFPDKLKTAIAYLSFIRETQNTTVQITDQFSSYPFSVKYLKN